MKDIKRWLMFTVIMAASLLFLIPTIVVRSNSVLSSLIYLPLVLRDPAIPSREVKIAFSGGPETTFELYTIHPDGNGLSQLTTLNDDIESISWSPDGSKLLFVGQLADRDIYTITEDGTSLQNLTDNLSDDGKPSWSPNGAQIVFASNRSGSSEIYRMDADGTAVVQLTNLGSSAQGPLWSPDGSMIVFSSGTGTSSEIYRISPDGTNLTQITNNSVSDTPYQWSPDSASLLIWSKRYGSTDLILIDLNDTEIVNLSISGEPWGATFSPDGTQIVYSIDGGAWWQTFVLTLDGSDPVTIECNGSPFKSSFFDWEPNGDRIVYSTDPTSALKILDMNTGTCTQIAEGLHGVYPS